jgi:hypothetical protein
MHTPSPNRAVAVAHRVTSQPPSTSLQSGLHAIHFHQLAQALLERLSLHVIGVASKSSVQPACVGRILARATVAAKCSEMLINEAGRVDPPVVGLPGRIGGFSASAGSSGCPPACGCDTRAATR